MFLKSVHFPEWPSFAVVDFIVLPEMVKLYSRPHRHPMSLSKISKFLYSPDFTVFVDIKLGTHKPKLRFSWPYTKSGTLA